MLAYLRYDEEHPHGAWAAYLGLGRTGPVLRGVEDMDNDRQADRIMGRIGDAGFVADTCAHALLDAIGRVPGLPAELVCEASPEHR